MVSTVKTRPNYYEMLGLAPGATADAVAQAFARATSMFRPHAFGGLTEICVAFETLRDPLKRHAYDESLGLIRERTPRVQPYSGSASAHFAGRPAIGATQPSPPSANPEPEPQFQPLPEPAQDMPSRPLNIPLAADPIELRFTGPADVAIRPVEWNRTAMLIGGLAGAAILFGALAGWWSSSSAAETGLPKPAESAKPIVEKAPPSFAELWTDPSPPVVEARAEPPRRALTARRSERSARPAELAATEAEQELIQPPEDLAGEPQADPLAPAAATAPAMAANMPLPHRTVARTIDRIGYRCGSVASATAVEGAGGVYKVTCTSGQSFQAKPVNGRYRFRRLANN